MFRTNNVYSPQRWVVASYRENRHLWISGVADQKLNKICHQVYNANSCLYCELQQQKMYMAGSINRDKMRGETWRQDHRRRTYNAQKLKNDIHFFQAFHNNEILVYSLVKTEYKHRCT